MTPPPGTFSPAGRRWLLAGLVVGAVVRLWMLPFPGSPDVGSWKIWAYTGAKDPTSLYGVGGHPPERRLIAWNGMSGTTEYPPVALYQMGLAGAIYTRIDPSFTDSPTLTRLVKVPGLLAEIAFVAAVLAWRRRLGPGAPWIALAIWLNPAVLINGAALGYLDAQMAIPAALSLVAACLGSPALAGALLALAILTKAQALFVAPIVPLAIWRGGTSGRYTSLVRATTAGAITSALILGPIVVRGAWPNMVQAISRLGAHDMVSGYALNFWWLVTWIVRASYALTDLDWFTAFTMPVRILGIQRMIEVGYPSPKPIGAVVVIVLIACAVWRARYQKALPVLALTASWCVYAYTMFSAQVHENHAYLAVPVLALAAGLDAGLRRLFWCVSAMTALNMYLFYGLGEGWPPIVDRRWTVLDLTVILAFANVALFVWFSRAVLRETGRPAGTSVSASDSDILSGARGARLAGSNQ